MNAKISNREKELIIHALGLTPKKGKSKFGRRWAYRNYFCAGIVDEPIWKELVAKGFARERTQGKRLTEYRVFYVTPDGAKEAGAYNYIPNSMWNNI